MKKSVLITIMSLGLFMLNAQTLNDKGLYIENSSDPNASIDKLFNGVITKTQDGIKSDFMVKDGVIDGPANYYFASGKLMESGSFTKGQKDQKWVRYTEAGSISAIAFYNLGKKHGTWLVFDDNGKKRFEMNYTNGDKTGVWTSWDENGAVLNTKDYSQVN
jgi:antitoxin component YwqK of YwqJK toxin-antitoxin module